MSVVACDTETTGLLLHTGDKMFAWSTCDIDGQTEVHRLDGSPLRRLRGQALLRALVERWERGEETPTFYNAKFDLTAIEYGVNRRFAEGIRFHDTYIMHHLLRNDHPTRRLKDIAWELAGIPKDDERAVKQVARGYGGDYSSVDESLMQEYQEKDALRTILLHLFLWPRVQQSGMEAAYERERQAALVTMRMEERGLMLRLSACPALLDTLGEWRDEALAELRALAGHTFNPDSPPQVRRLLFRTLGMPVIALTVKGRVPSTDRDVLHELRDDYPAAAVVVEPLLRYRAWSKGIAQVKNYLRLADADGVLHPEIVSLGAVTGREACRNPNLQNVHRMFGQRGDYAVPVRRVFRPRPGYVNFHLDYSGIEFRLLCHYSGDEALIAMIKEGVDPHKATARILWPLFLRYRPPVRGELRELAKTVNFGGAYGASDHTLQQGTAVGKRRPVPRQRILDWRAAFPGLGRLATRVRREAQETGEVWTLGGRRLRINRAKPYVATNHLIQGSAADVLKAGKVAAHGWLEEATGGEAKLLLSIHDELILEYPRSRLADANDVLPELVRRLVDFPGLLVPLAVDVAVVTASWAHKHPWSLGGLGDKGGRR